MKNIILLTCLSALSCCLASELSFILEPSDVIAVRDRPLMLHCQVQGEQPITITWRKNGLPLPSSPRVQVLENGTLLIQRFQKRRDGSDADMGEYDCAAQNRYGMLVSRKAKVNLASLPKFHTHPVSMFVDEGGVARFQCQINGVPEATITWEKDRRPLNTSDSRYTLLPMGILQITGVRRTDSGIFRCVASNIANTRYSHEATLNVTGGAPRTYKEPVILSGPQNLTLTVHQTAILECIATGNPRPIVSWSRLDGRSIGVEGIQVLGTGNLMISDVSLQHSGVYVCAANRPGTRMRRTALGRLVVQAPPEFLQWPQSVSRPAGGSAVFTCVAQGVPDPHLIWLKNGKVLTPGQNVKLTNNNSTLALTRISSDDEAIYQCIAENSAGTNQASARLAVAQAKDLPAAPQGLSASAVSTNTLQITWSNPPTSITDSIIGYVLHIRKLGEPDRLELQEAISKDTFQHDVTNLEASTTYSLYLKAYSALGASQQSNSIIATTLGSVPSPPTYFTKVLNSTTVQVLWELPGKPGKVEGFRLSFRRVPHTDYQEPVELPFYASSHTISDLESGAVYEIKLVAYNGNGESDGTKRLVSLAEQGISDQISGGNSLCQCRDSETSLGSIVIGIHIGTACIIFCVLFLMFGYRRSFFCSKGTQNNWPVPRIHAGQNNSPKEGANYPQVESEAQMVCPARCQVIIEQHPSGVSGMGTG
ncbi:PREDICTED: immunoglobulin superfamily DCC subclass member 3 isoform X1 [Cyprinodon variegatus]|uniref:immunoglobulin superfamily DCC subclass member 3 isoform X1 n=2 Tax=Cyprinodon variegatus TaxID=28743 RepID=UPI000742911A|nr:PREDICTED: immunoglobulin superfamily DCC subclass member 3 isoform X1 [Cyprinodon variegatus]